MTPAPISRRALVLGGLGAASLTAGATGWITGAAAGSAARLQPGPPGAELVAPRVLDSQDGRLQVELTAAAGVRLAGRDTHALGFNTTRQGRR